AQVRLLGRAGIPAARIGADRGPDLRRGRHPERVLLAVSAHRHLRLRRAAEQGGARGGESRDGRADELGIVPIYAFICEGCGQFELVRPMAEASTAAACPTCGTEARRVFTPPGLALLAT